MIILPLGTVSPYCKENKNCPGFLFCDGKNKILLDCGSGICSLLKFPEDLRNLIIVISHLHKDHYSDLSSIGYASFVYKNLGIIKDKIKVYIPNDIRTKDFEYLTNFGEENYFEVISYDSNSLINHGNVKLSFIQNPHPVLTYSIKLNNSKHSIVYSSDTGYKGNSLVSFAKNADLLICESTFLKNQTKKSDNHLYAYEAALIAKEANVKQLMLTHFWPEIEKEEYVKEANQIFSNTFAAEENKKITLRW